MPYAFLVGAILCECAGTYFMKLSDGFSQILPSAACLGFYAFCFFLLSKALQGIELRSFSVRPARTKSLPNSTQAEDVATPEHSDAIAF